MIITSGELLVYKKFEKIHDDHHLLNKASALHEDLQLKREKECKKSIALQILAPYEFIGCEGIVFNKRRDVTIKVISDGASVLEMDRG